MKIFSQCILLSIVFVLMIGCGKKMTTSQSVEIGKKAFTELYKMEADTCIQLDSVHFLFTRMVESPRQGDGDSVYVYILRGNNNEWSPLLSKGLMRGMSYSPVVSAEVVNLENKEYLYMEYDFGGGSMGNNWTDFILYDLKDTSNEYTLSFKYYPPEIETSSVIELSENLQRGNSLYMFLYEKLQANDLFQKSGNIAKAEDTPPMSGWKCYGLLGRVKSVKYTDGAYLEFNTDGNLTKRTTVLILAEGNKHMNTETNIYSSPNEYSNGGVYEYKIEYENNTRHEIEQGGEYFRDSFIFDNLGRLSKSEPNVSFDALTIEYKYKSETDIFPYKEIKNAGYEGGGGSFSSVSTFDYLKTDTRGNWIERKIEIKGYDEDEEGKKSFKTNNITEKREITYF